MDNKTELQDSQEPVEEEDSHKEENEILKKNRQLFERAKKAEEKARELEKKLELKEKSDEDDGDDDDSASEELSAIKKRMAEMEEQAQLEKLYAQYPDILERVDDFDTYRQENPGMSLQTAAKAYLVDKGLTGQTERKGLEPARGGVKTQPEQGTMTADEVRNLRETNFKEYRRLVSSGKITFSDK